MTYGGVGLRTRTAKLAEAGSGSSRRSPAIRPLVVDDQIDAAVTDLPVADEPR